MTKNVLLIGGTGAIGMYMAPYLVDDGFNVYITSRSQRKSDNPQITYLQGNGKDIEWLKTIATQYDFDAVVDFMMYDYNELKSKYQELLALSQQYIYLSSYRALANEETPLTGNSPRKVDVAKQHPELAEDKYGMTKGHQENLLRESGRQNWTIVRPSMTFSKNRFQFGAMDNWDIFRTVRGGATVLPEGMWELPATLVYGKDVALMISKLVTNDQALGRSFNVVTSESHTWHEIADIFGRVFGLKIAKVISNEAYIDMTGQHRTMVDRLLPRKFDNSDLLAVTGLQAEDFHTLEAGLNEAWIDSDRNRYYKGGTNWKIQADFDFVSETRLDLTGVSDKSKQIYNERLRELSPAPKQETFWKTRELNEAYELTRQGRHAIKKIKEPAAQVRVSVPKGIVQQNNGKIAVSLKYDSDVDASLVLTDGQQKRRQVIHLTADKWQKIILDVPTKWQNTELVFSANDFKISGKKLWVMFGEVETQEQSSRNDKQQIKTYAKRIKNLAKHLLSRG
jgi:nucleoside-diphosphate-sugar epimerase